MMFLLRLILLIVQSYPCYGHQVQSKPKLYNDLVMEYHYELSKRYHPINCLVCCGIFVMITVLDQLLSMNCMSSTSLICIELPYRNGFLPIRFSLSSDSLEKPLLSHLLHSQSSKTMSIITIDLHFHLLRSCRLKS